ncbi:heme-degrading domain-containing protein [Arthrobacter sp. Br18]|uniref:heme-degrading domain-containing protein n=1 Tax=Arthrobacter sp. Br18 TaxID=1312954 RepID=UPI0004B53330|nr:heme-degrading domain-containing protein [Arthrobacter sp. Br18]
MEPEDAPFDPDDPGVQSDAALNYLVNRIEAEMAELQLEHFSNSSAVALGMLLVELGTARALPVAIGIRRSGQVLFHAALDGATPDNDLWLLAKSRTAERYAVPSLLVGLRARLTGGRAEDNPLFDPAVYAAHGGSFPLAVRGAGPVATVTVSGLPQLQDHDLVVEALRLHLHAADA